MDPACAEAVELARAEAVAMAGGDVVGEHLGVVAEADRVVTHRFESTQPGYVGWHWSVTVVRAARAKAVTVNECVLLPGDTAVLAPEWLPWEDRVRPDDLGAGDLIPVPEHDPRLEPGYTDADKLISDIDLRQVVDELGLGRERVLSRFGRIDAAQRWYEGDGGPYTDIAKAAPAPCSTCGFAVPVSGLLGQSFGVCTNERTPFDGTTVSWDHGCGGHSDVQMVAVDSRSAGGDEPVHDTVTLDEVGTH